MYQAGDRRPIAARNFAISAAVAAWLVRRGASANAISLAGMAAGMLGGIALAAIGCKLAPAWPLWLLAAACAVLRLLANMFDGMVALASGTASPVGELFNDVPDRISDTAILLGLGVAAHHPALGLAAGMAAMATAYIRTLGKSLGAASDFSGPMAKPQRMHAVIALGLWCALVPPRWGTQSALPWIVLALITILAGLTAARRLARIAAVLRQGRPA